MRARYAAVLILFCASLGLAQEVKFQDVVLNNGGFPFPTIRVCTEPASGTPCTPLATGIFSDPGGTQPLSNPFTGDATGNFTFYGSATAVYHVQVSGVGIQTYDIPYIVLPSPSGTTAQCIATVATLTSQCGTIPGTIASVTDGVSQFDCSTGLSTSKAACIYNGVAWVPISQNVCSAYVLQVGGTGLTCGDTVNFNAATPAAPTDGFNVTFATSKVGSVDSVSASVVGDGNAAHCLLGNGTFGTCGSPITLQTNTVNNSSQSLLNLVAGSGITLTNTSGGNVTIASSGGPVTGSGSTNTIPIWTSTTALGDSPLRDQVNASWPGGGITSFAHTLFVTPQNAFIGASCFDLTPVCVSQSWTAISNGEPQTGITIINGLNGAALSGLGSSPHLVGLHIYNGLATGTNSGTLPAQAGIFITSESGAETVTNNYGIYMQAMDTSTGPVAHHYGIFMEDQTTTDNAGTPPVDPWGIYVTAGKSYFGSMVQFAAAAFSTLPSCTSGVKGNVASITDSTTSTWGATITGSGATSVLGYCDGSHWTVAGATGNVGNYIISSSTGQIIQSGTIAPCNSPSCAVTFPHTFTSTPHCVATGWGGSVDINTSSPPSTTTLTLDSSGIADVTWMCIGAN